MKIYILMAILCIGMIGYAIIEWVGKTKPVVINEKPDFELVADNEVMR